SDGNRRGVEVTDLSRPTMLTSSSLGDSVVDEPRRGLFEQLFAHSGRSWLESQDRFHRHQWRSRRHVSVRMERPHARTVSYTVVTVSSSAIQLRYRPVDSIPTSCVLETAA